MASKNYVISETGEFPPQYNVLKLDDDGVYKLVFGPDPDLSDAERKCAEMNGERSRNEDNHHIADDSSTSDVNEGQVSGKTPQKKKAPAKKKAAAKKSPAKKKVVKKK
tara:strand:- start:394 stop:717 length:324 start_codon:yes stop_codon:yes gene_type:complete